MPVSHPQQIKPARPAWIRRPVSTGADADFPIVAIGASAGGLEACRKLLDALPAKNGMAFLLVQHLDPSHDSMMVDLLARNTTMTVLEATDGMAIERERVYVIPPGVYLSVNDQGALQLSQPAPRHGARLPFDFLLNSLARECGGRTVCVVLSGTGADGSLGLRAVKAKGGLVIAQEVGEADYDGMPQNAIATGEVDLVLSAAKIAEALVSHEQGAVLASTPRTPHSRESVQAVLPKIIDLLRTTTVHDFTLYKHGTLERRVERRMAMAATKTKTASEYLALLLRDSNERDQLSRDLLINVTGFFRDPPVFDFLEKSVIPDLVRDHDLDRPLRIWIAGCSSGEETYSARHAVSRADRASQSATSNCRSSPATSTRTRWRSLVTASIPNRSRPTCRRVVWRHSSPGTIIPTGCRPSCAPAWCSPCRTFWPTRRSRVSTSFRAGTF